MARDTSPTDRRGYDRPAIGDDWADAWDGLVEDIDKISVERGPIADRPSSGEYDDSLYLATDQRILWRWDAGTSDWEAQAGLGTASDPVPGTSHFESVNTGKINNTVFASENISSLPSIQDGLNNLIDGDKHHIAIVGGVNEINQTIVFPQVGSPTDDAYVPKIETIGAVIKQADGANLDTIIKTGSNGGRPHADVTIDGNRANNSTDVTGVYHEYTITGRRLKANIYGCDVGVRVDRESDGGKYDLRFEDCDVGFDIRGAVDDKPDENEINITARRLDGPVFRSDGNGFGPIATHLRLNCELIAQNSNYVVELRNNSRVFLHGIIRDESGKDGILVDSSELFASNMLIGGVDDAIVLDNGATASISNMRFNVGANSVNALDSNSTYSDVLPKGEQQSLSSSNIGRHLFTGEIKQNTGNGIKAREQLSIEGGTVSSYKQDTDTHIYRSDGGGSEPFDQFGNTIFEKRDSSNHAFYFVSGGNILARINDDGSIDVSGSVNQNVTF